MTTELIQERRIISLNSLYASKRNSTYNSNVLFNFTNVLSNDLSLVDVECGIYNAQIPVSFYTIDSRNNVLFYSVNGSPFSINISPGNYNSTTLFSELITQFGKIPNNHSISISISKTTGICTFSMTSSGTLNYFTDNGSTAFTLLGFVSGSGNFPASSNTIVAPQMLNLLGIKKLKIYSDALAVSSVDSKNLSKTSLVDTIPVNASGYQLLQYFNTRGPYSRITVPNITQLDIQIKDENGNFVNFQGIDWCITIVLILHREPLAKNGDLAHLLNNIESVLEDIDKNIVKNKSSEVVDVEPEDIEKEQINPLIDVGDLDILEHSI